MSVYPAIEPFRHGMLDVADGHSIYWEECGNPAGAPALVIHGGPGSGCTPWHRRLFDPAAYRIVLFDQRGAGRSTPHASEADAASFATNTTQHLVGDIERLRQSLGIDRWLLWGGSWGSTLALTYAETHPERVRAIVIAGVTTSRPKDLEWLCGGGLAELLPGPWERFLAEGEVPPDASALATYYRHLHDGDPARRQWFAESWCRWETAVLTMGQGPELSARYLDPRFALGFTRTVTHYFHHGAWLEEGQIVRDAHQLADIQAALIHGRFDVSAPLGAAWELAKAWPAAELVLVENAGHAANEPEIARQIIAATDRLRSV